MNFFWVETAIKVISMPFILVVLTSAMIAMAYLVYLIIKTVQYRAKMGLRDLKIRFLWKKPRPFLSMNLQ